MENSPIGVVPKISDDICQLRLDFQTFSGFATTTPTGTCSDYMSAAGQTGRDPPDICGTNTDYHSKYLAVCLLIGLRRAFFVDFVWLPRQVPLAQLS